MARKPDLPWLNDEVFKEWTTRVQEITFATGTKEIDEQCAAGGAIKLGGRSAEASEDKNRAESACLR